MSNLWMAIKHNPVLVNELRSRMRGKRTFWLLAAHLLVLSGLMFIIYVTVYQDSQVKDYYYGGGFQRALQASSTLGKSFFYGANLLMLFIVSLVGPSFTAGAIVSEKDRQSYDLLTITALSPRAIVMGKLNAILIFMGLLIFATLPFQGMAFFFGGVAFKDILLAVGLLLLTTLLFCSWGVFVSSFARSTTIANMINYGAIVPMLLGVPFFAFLIGVLSSGAFLDRLFRNPTFLVAAILSYGILFFISINPLSMAIATFIFVQETGSYVFSIERFFDAQIPIVAPWVIFVVFALIASFVFIKAAIYRVGRVPRE